MKPNTFSAQFFHTDSRNGKVCNALKISLDLKCPLIQNFEFFQRVFPEFEIMFKRLPMLPRHS